MIGAWRADDVYEPSVIETVLPARPELLMTLAAPLAVFGGYRRSWAVLRVSQI